jgi:hypothetical protein
MNEKIEPMLPMLVDEGEEEIARIREVRHHISEQFGHDPYKLVAYYMELQKEHPEKLVPAPESEFTGKARSE